MELLRLWRILAKRRAWVVIPFLGALAMAIIASFLIKPSYQATAKVLLEQKEKEASVLGPGLPDTGNLNTLSKTGTPLDTQAEVAQRSAIVDRVLLDTGLCERGEDPSLLESKFLKAGQVSALHGTDILAFTYRHSDPKMVQRVVNRWAKAYVEDNRTLSRQQMQHQEAFLKDQLKDARKELNRAGLALRDFRQRYAVIPPDEEARASAQTLSMLEAELRQSSAASQESAARLRTLRRQVGLSPSQALNSAAVALTPGVERLNTQLQEAETDLALLKRRLTSTHPDVLQREAQVAALRRQLAVAAGRAGDRRGTLEAGSTMDPLRQSLTRDLMATEVTTVGSESREAALRGLISSYSARLAALPGKQHQLTELERSAALASDRVNMLQRNLEETRLKLAMDLGSAKVIELAPFPEDPTTPGGSSLLLAGVIVGLGLGTGLALLREYLDDSIKSVSEAEAVAGLPLWEVLPWHDTRAGLATLSAADSPASEAFRSVRARLLRPDGSLATQLLAFTSVGPQEGKSLTVANLGVSFAQLGHKVLIVDANLREPAQHHLFKRSNRHGLASVLQGVVGLAWAVQPSPVANLSIMTAGPRPQNPSELLASRLMAALLEEVRAHYDLILLDLPAAMATSDAALLAGRTDGLVMVLGLDRVSPEATHMAVEKLQASGGRLLGLVLSGLHRRGLWREVLLTLPRPRAMGPEVSAPLPPSLPSPRPELS